MVFCYFSMVDKSLRSCIKISLLTVSATGLSPSICPSVLFVPCCLSVCLPWPLCAVPVSRYWFSSYTLDQMLPPNVSSLLYNWFPVWEEASLWASLLCLHPLKVPQCHWAFGDNYTHSIFHLQLYVNDTNGVSYLQSKKIQHLYII